MNLDKPAVVLVGRTNVGKSSLFNRLTETKKALVSRIAGTTRDFNKGITEWQGYQFFLIDTGGIDLSKPDKVEEKVLEQVWKIIDKAERILLVTDAKEGLVANDENIAQELRKRGKDFMVVANKADSPKLRESTTEFFKLDNEVFPLSAANGTGTGELLDYLISTIFKGKDAVSGEEQVFGDEIQHSLAVTLAGMPNAGKSTLLNSILGREEVIVSPEPHTTREPRDTYFQYGDHLLKLVDTAGIRKARKLRWFLTRKSVDRSLEAISDSDWVIHMIDATEPKWGEQDRYILDNIIKSGKSVIVAANKWDLLKGEDRYKEFQDRWQRSFSHFYWIPVVPISALTGWHVDKLLKKIIELDQNRKRELPQSALDRLLKAAIKRRRPQKKKGPEAPYIHTIQQIDTSPPTFEVVIDYKDTLAESYVRFIEKALREKFDFEATPIRVYVRALK